MKIKISELRQIIRETLDEIGGPSGSIRGSNKSSSGRKVKLGKIEEENKELSPFEAESRFPGSTEAWADIVPELFPDFPFAHDRVSIVRGSLWFKVGDKLQVSFKDLPQLELASWDQHAQDWILSDEGETSLEDDTY